jgi:hypothetical protein
MAVSAAAASELHQTALRETASAVTYAFRHGLELSHPGRYVLESGHEPFHLEAFAGAGHCELVLQRPPVAQMMTHWRGPGRGLSNTLRNGLYQVRFGGRALEVAVLTRTATYCDETTWFVVADEEALARRFFDAVSEWSYELRDEVLVFQDARWEKDPALFQSIQGTTFDDVVLAGSLKDEIRRDCRQFLDARERYESHGVPWKRGVLMLGPPGNGKTLCVKAIVNLLAVPCLYVKSFKAQYETAHACIHRVFERARKTTPCVLVLEDLDSLLDGESRAFFLNELDGFASNTGIITVATTNHPDRLDPAILDRPSRFDMKYQFDLPGAAERGAYLDLWNRKLVSDLRLAEATVARVVEGTEGFSFAYLKELYLSALMRWGSRAGDFSALVLEQIDPLRAQMAAKPEEP